MNILILHGWKTSLESSIGWYQPLINELKKLGHRVYAPDFPGFATNKPLDRPLSVADYAEWTNRFITKQKLKNLVIIGHSFGGRVAIKLVAHHPHCANLLVLTGVPGYPPVTKKRISLLKLVAKTGGLIFSVPLLHLLAYPMRKLFYRFIRSEDYNQTDGMLRETFKIVIAEDLVSSMRKITLDTKLIWGNDDTITPVWIGRKMQKTIRKSTITIIPDTTHNVLIKQPKKFIDAIGTIE